MSPTSPVYLDHAATTPMLPAAIEAMTAVLGTVGNASSLHTAGRVARRRMEESRETVAAVLGARPSEVIFTAGGTESDNLAIKGIYWARSDAQPRRRRIVTSAVEHHAIPRLTAEAAKQHHDTTYHVTQTLGVDDLILDLLEKRAKFCTDNEFVCDNCRGTIRCGQPVG